MRGLSGSSDMAMVVLSVANSLNMSLFERVSEFDARRPVTRRQPSRSRPGSSSTDCRRGRSASRPISASSITAGRILARSSR